MNKTSMIGIRVNENEIRSKKMVTLVGHGSTEKDNVIVAIGRNEVKMNVSFYDVIVSMPHFCDDEIVSPNTNIAVDYIKMIKRLTT